MFFRDSVDPYEGLSQYLLIVPWRLSQKSKTPKVCHVERKQNICLSEEKILRQAQNDIKYRLLSPPLIRSS
jgi:hypothetical protein